MVAWYNENDAFAAAWLELLIEGGHIAQGVVDRRDIRDVRPSDLDGYTQCHFFAGIGGWSLALRLAGWPDDRPVWTGSCPCQPFSQAGRRKGADDERHLWPYWRWLVDQCRPAVVFGEQVASKDGRAWLSDVRADMEAMAYGFGAADLCAAGIGEKGHPLVAQTQALAQAAADRCDDPFRAADLCAYADWLDGLIVGAPHIRQRLWWVGISNSARSQSRERAAKAARHGRSTVAAGGTISPVANCAPSRCGEERQDIPRRAEGSGAQGAGQRLGCDDDALGLEQPESQQMGLPRQPREQGNSAVALGESKCSRQQKQGRVSQPVHSAQGEVGQVDRTEHAGYVDHWSNFTLIPCIDGKARVAHPEIFPLAHGISNRVGGLRGSGNAIVPELGAVFIMASIEARK